MASRDYFDSRIEIYSHLITNDIRSAPCRSELRRSELHRTIANSIICLLVVWTGFFNTELTASAQISFSQPAKELSRLSIDDPAAYRDLAEEYSVVRKSKIAQNLAVRLYLIAAKHGDAKLRRSALRGLIHVARNDEELRKFKVLAFLSDPVFADVLTKRKREQLPLSPKASLTKKNSVAKAGSQSPKEKLLDALMSIRRGKSMRAQRMMDDLEVQKVFAQFSELMSVDDFKKACLDSDIDDATLYKVITIDLKLRYGADSLKPRESDAAWKEVFEGKLPDKVPEISFATVTEFNPDHTKFLNGRWQNPTD